MSARIRFRQRIYNQKKNVFFLPSARIRLLPISQEKIQLISEDKIKFRKTNNFISRDKKLFSSYVFFACFFRKPSLTFCQIDQQFFYFVALISFSRNLSNIFIYVVGLTFPKIGLMFFFLYVFFTAFSH